MRRGDEVTRTTTGGAVEKVILPAIDMAHLADVTVNVASVVNGFHVLPGSTAPITSNSPFILPAGSVRVLDPAGTPIVGATVEVTPLRVPASSYDAFEARVRVFDSSGALIGTNPAKSFFPQGWTDAQIQQGIYSAYARAFQSGGAPFGRRLPVTTPEGVDLEIRVKGTQTSSGITLTGIPTAFLRQGQHLDATHVPQYRADQGVTSEKKKKGGPFMSSIPMPRFELTARGSPVATWDHEEDERWLVAVFLRGDLGLSLVVIDDVLAGLDSLIAKRIARWSWAANSCMIHATLDSCRLELMDRDLPPDFPVVVLPPSQVKEIVLAWKQFVLSHPWPGGHRATHPEDCRSGSVE